MAKDIYFRDKQNGSTYTEQNSSWNSDAFKEKLALNGMTFPESKKDTYSVKPGKPVPNTQKPPKKKKKKHSKAKTILCVVLCAVLALSLFVSLGAAVILKNYDAAKMKDNAYISESMLKSSPAVTNILLLGVDNADLHSDSRSDSMILLSIDSIHGRLKLTSFMRDMLVEIPGYGKTKLTHACQYGGAQLTADTIELNFGIRIDAYAKIGYDFLKDVVDGIGGVTVSEIDETEAAALKREWVHVEPGKNIHLDVNQTLQYCRIRKGQSDFQRTERQREVFSLIVKKAMRTNPVSLLKIASGAISKIECSIPESRLITLMFKILPCLVRQIGQQQIPADGTWRNAEVSGMAVLQIDLEANKTALENFIYK